MSDGQHQRIRFAPGVDRTEYLYSKTAAGDHKRNQLSRPPLVSLPLLRDSLQIASVASRIISRNRFSEAMRKKRRT